MSWSKSLVGGKWTKECIPSKRNIVYKDKEVWERMHNTCEEVAKDDTRKVNSLDFCWWRGFTAGC